MSEPNPTGRAAMACGRWLAYCLSIGWSRSALDRLEQIWWNWHGDDGKLLDKPRQPH